MHLFFQILYLFGSLNWYLSQIFFGRKFLKAAIVLFSLILKIFFLCFIFRVISFEKPQQFAERITLIKFSSQSSFHFYCLVFIPKDFMLMVIMLEEFLFDRVHTLKADFGFGVSFSGIQNKVDFCLTQVYKIF